MKMKKYSLFIISLLTIILIPFNANAAGNVTLSVNCTNALVGQEASCTVYATPTAGIMAASGTISISGSSASYTSSSLGSLQGEVTNTKFNLYGNTFNSKIALFTLKFNGASAGTTTVSATLNYFADSDGEDNNTYSPASGRITISAPQTPTTQPTTKTTVKPTTQTPTTRGTSQGGGSGQLTTVPVEQTTQKPNLLYLTGISVDEFEVKEEGGIYYVTTDENREYVTINATAPNGVSVIGTGKRNLSVGKNSVSLVLRDEFGETATISLIITRPDGGNANTLLRMLEVVNYKLDFDPNTMEYTVTVPYNINQVYLYAVAQSPDVSITGDGVLVLNGNETTTYVNVSYGDLAKSTYTVHIKKSYLSLLPTILLSIGLIGGMGGCLYLSMKVKEKDKQLANNRIAVKAEEERREKSLEPGLTINGSQTTGVGQRVVEPTVVPQVQPAQVSVEPEVKTVQTKVVNTRPTTISGMVAPKVVPVNNLSQVASAPAPQVKVVKKVVTPVNTHSVVQQVQVNTNNN
jgi:hypothetical protein